MKSSIDVLASASEDPDASYQVHIDGGGTDDRSSMGADPALRNGLLPPLPDAVVHVRKDIHLVHEAV